ncbi:MAG: hypothetical protein CM1200mP14_20120 [Gammaproteobacteria bacterium]|nr:MAG: hypothetical protein CM1200mP14_20120 [Gammaproteobacteria bacterium]
MLMLALVGFGGETLLIWSALVSALVLGFMPPF